MSKRCSLTTGSISRPRQLRCRSKDLQRVWSCVEVARAAAQLPFKSSHPSLPLISPSQHLWDLFLLCLAVVWPPSLFPPVLTLTGNCPPFPLDKILCSWIVCLNHGDHCEGLFCLFLCGNQQLSTARDCLNVEHQSRGI